MVEKKGPQNNWTDDERRKTMRIGVRIWFKLKHYGEEKVLGDSEEQNIEDGEEQILDLVSDNISQEGAYIEGDGSPLPQAGEKIILQVQNKRENAPVMRAEVVRNTGNGIAVRFLEPERSR